MDPVSATSLASAIIQLAGFTGKVLSRLQELYRSADGALLRHSELSSVAIRFQTMLKELEASVDSLGGKTSMLLPVVREAEVVTQSLIALLERLKGAPGLSGRWRSVRQALLTLWKEEKLRELQAQLD